MFDFLSWMGGIRKGKLRTQVVPITIITKWSSLQKYSEPRISHQPLKFKDCQATEPARRFAPTASDVLFLTMTPGSVLVSRPILGSYAKEYSDRG